MYIFNIHKYVNLHLSMLYTIYLKIVGVLNTITCRDRSTVESALWVGLEMVKSAQNQMLVFVNKIQLIAMKELCATMLDKVCLARVQTTWKELALVQMAAK